MDNNDKFETAFLAMQNVREHLQYNADILQSQILGKLGVFIPISSIKRTEELGVNFINEDEFLIDVCLPYPGDTLVEIRLVLTSDLFTKSIELDKFATIH